MKQLTTALLSFAWVTLGVLGGSQSSSADDGQFVNLSNRGLVGTGDDVRIVGFIIEGGSRQVLIQALGPELANRGVSNPLDDPVLTVIQESQGEPPRTPLDSPIEIMVNDNWEDSQGQLVSDLWGGSPPLAAGSLSAAVVLNLEPGGYTAKVEGKNGTTGVAIVEVFRITPDTQPSFAVGSGPGNQSFTVDTAISALTLPEASGGNGALTYSLTPAIPGLNFNPTTRRLTGTPTSEGTHSMTYTVTDADGDSDSLVFTIILTIPRTLLAMGRIAGQTLVAGASETTIRVGAAFVSSDQDELTYSAFSSDENVARIGMSGSTLSITSVSEGATTATVTAMDSEGLEATLTFPVTVETLAPRHHNIILRVVHVTTDWMPYAARGGWPSAALPKESAALKYFEAAIWDETASIHLYEFDNNFNPIHDAGTDSAQIAYREQYVVRKHTGMPSDRMAREDFVKSAFVDFAGYIAERFPDSDHHLLYSGHGGPGGRLFAGLLSREGAAEFLGTWREALGRRLGVIDMGGPCNKGGLSDLENFCAHARYYIASDLPNGGYTLDNWTIERRREVEVERQYHSFLDTRGTLEEALLARIDLMRKRYEYSRQDMIAKKVEQANYLYSCTNTMSELGWNARLFIEESGGSYDYGRDLWNYLTVNDAPKPLLEMFDQAILHDANNRDFFAWEEISNGIMMCCR